MLAIEIVPSPETNSHEVLLLGDGRDLIRSVDNGLMGLDPDDILVEPTPLGAGPERRQTTLGRCGCGEVGCGSLEAFISRQADVVTWALQHYQGEFCFDAAQYEAELHRAVSDTSWETPDRAAARLIRSAVPHSTLTRRGFIFSWASGRVRQGKMTASLTLEPGPYQVLLHSPWDERTPEAAAVALVAILRTDPLTWTDVEYFPQAQDLGAPSVAGPGWRGAS